MLRIWSFVQLCFILDKCSGQLGHPLLPSCWLHSSLHYWARQVLPLFCFDLKQFWTKTFVSRVQMLSNDFAKRGVKLIALSCDEVRKPLLFVTEKYLCYRWIISFCYWNSTFVTGGQPQWLDQGYHCIQQPLHWLLLPHHCWPQKGGEHLNFDGSTLLGQT